MTSQYTLAELSQYLGVELVGDRDQLINSLASLANAGPEQLSFVANPAYRKYLADTSAAAVILPPELANNFAGNKLLMSNPYLGYARLTELFDLSPPFAEPGIHPTAVIGPDCQLAEDVSIGPHVVLGRGVSLASGVTLGPGTSIGADSTIGANSRLAAQVSVYHGVSIGANCLIHSGAVIGADGFGFAPDRGRWQKIHQLGGVIIGSAVEIGACTTIDRGALDNTLIEDGVKIDNQVQIAHNVRIGKNTAIAAQAAIAGSVWVGENCTIAGCVGITGHVKIADRVHITAMSMVSGSIKESGSYSSGTPLSTTVEWRKNAVRFKQLNAFAARLKQLEKDKD